MKNKIQDERVEQNRTKALAHAAIIGEIILLAKILFEILTDRATLNVTGWNIALLIIMNIVTVISLYRSKTVNIPKTLFGRSLTTNLSKQAKKERVIKSYIPEGLIGAAGMLVGSYLKSGSSGLAPTVILFLMFFGSYLIVSYFWNEHNIKKYNEDLED